MATLERVIGLTAYQLRELYYRCFRPVTLGVKAIILEDERNVLLVRHTYLPGWHLPGGGVHRGESVTAAIVREVREETGIECGEPGRLLGVYANLRSWQSDHIVAFVFTQWKEIEWRRPSLEIAERGFFPLNNLPETTTAPTRRRLAELGGASLSHSW